MTKFMEKVRSFVKLKILTWALNKLSENQQKFMLTSYFLRSLCKHIKAIKSLLTNRNFLKVRIYKQSWVKFRSSKTASSLEKIDQGLKLLIYSKLKLA